MRAESSNESIAYGNALGIMCLHTLCTESAKVKTSSFVIYYLQSDKCKTRLLYLRYEYNQPKP